jgi:hypothetical protein
VAGGVDHAVDEDDGRPAAGDAVDRPVPVQIDLVRLEAARGFHSVTLSSGYREFRMSWCESADQAGHVRLRLLM